MRALVYTRVSTREQGDSGLGLAAQRTKCMAEIGAREWTSSGVIEETASASGKRPEFDRALRLLDVGQAQALVVARLDRLSRSVGEFAALMDRAHRNGWAIVVLDPPVDLTTAFGRAMAGVAAVFAQLERELGSQRTKEGLRALRERGVTKTGKVYEPSQPYGEVSTIRRIVRMREQGQSLRAIADFLTEAGVPSPADVGAWNHKSVGRILAREEVSA